MNILERPAAILPVAACLALLGAWVVVQESRLYFVNGATSVSRVVALPDGEAAPGLSNLTTQATLLDCATALSQMRSLEMRYHTDPEREAIPPRCLTIADDAVAAAPTNSYAWFVAAASAAAIGDWAAFNDRMAHSQVTGPTEQWIAQQRVEVVEDHYDKATPEVLAQHDADLHMLVASAAGIESIARRYVSVPGFRERITAIVETMPQSDQRRFISVVRREFQS